MALQFAVSIQTAVEKYGVYLGIAAFFGFSLLILLYFSQARELKRLREWAGRNPERDQDLDEVRQEIVSMRRTPAAHAGVAQPRINGGHVNPGVAGVSDRGLVGVANGSSGPRVPVVAPANSHAPGATDDPSIVGAAANAAQQGSPSAVAVHNLPTDLHVPEGVSQAAGAASKPGSNSATVAHPEPGSSSATAAEVTPKPGSNSTTTAKVTPKPSSNPATAAGTQAQTGGDQVSSVQGQDRGGPLSQAPGQNGVTGSLKGSVQNAESASPKEEGAKSAIAPQGSQSVQNNLGKSHSQHSQSPVALQDPKSAQGEGAVPSADQIVQRAAALRSHQPSATTKQPPRPAALRGQARPPANRGNGRSGVDQRAASRSSRTNGRPPGGSQAKKAPTGGRRRGVLALVGGAIAVGIAVWALGGGSDDKKKPVKQAKTQTAKKSSAKSALPAKVATKVAVLNGTTIGGLANKVSNRLSAAGFGRGQTGNNNDQRRTASLVLYKPSSRARAMEVAGLLKISEVIPLDTETASLAGQDADVVVVIGADQTH